MKKITLLSALVIAGLTMNAQELTTNPNQQQGTNQGATIPEGGITLTQSVDPLTIDTGGVACWNSGNGEYRDNSFYRVYDLAAFGVTGAFEVSELQWGQGSADASNVLALNLYSADTDDLSVAVLDFLDGTSHSSDPGDDLTLVSAAWTTTVPAGTTYLVFEVFSPDGATATDVRYFPGFNLTGENDEGYLKADACGIVDPTPASTVVADQEYVMNVLGDNVAGVSDNLADLISVFPNPATTRINLEVPADVNIESVVLYDILGKNTGATLVNGSIDVSGLSRGAYILNINTNRGALTQKVMKQ